MRVACAFTLWIAVTGGVVLAGFEMPKSVYRMNEFEAAKAEAKAKNKPLTFIYTSESSSCGLLKAASLGAADRLRAKSILVYANSPADFGSLPPLVQTAIKSEAAGKFIPKTVIVDAEMNNTIAIVPYASGSEFENSLKDARSSISKSLRETNEKPRLLPPPSSSVLSGNSAGTSTELPEPRIWRSASGTEIKATLIRKSGGFVELQKEDGGMVKIKPTQLCPADQEFLAKQ